MENAYFQKILDPLANLLGAESGTLKAGNTKEDVGTYFQKLQGKYKDLETIYIGTSDCQALLQIAVDRVVRAFHGMRLIPFQDPNKLFYRSDTKGTSSNDDVANCLYAEIGDWLKTRYKTVLGLDFDVIDMLSNAPYEGEAARGEIAFLPDLDERDCAKLEPLPLVRFTENKRLALNAHNIKQVRKVLAGSHNNCLLLYHDEESREYLCYGFIPLDRKNEFPYCIEIRGPYNWVLSKEGEPLFEMINGNPRIIVDEIENAFSLLQEEFKGDPNQAAIVEKMKTAIHAISQQHHGTSVIFLDLASGGPAHDWMENLVNRKRALPTKNVHLLQMQHTKEQGKFLANLGRIDGALVVDVNTGELQYTAAIVDGLAIVDGHLDRGARHNSIKTFIANLYKKQTDGRMAALVFSEDGGVKIIRGSEIAQEIKQEENSGIKGVSP